MSDIDHKFNLDTCSFGFAGARYCSRINDAWKRIAELEDGNCKLVDANNALAVENQQLKEQLRVRGKAIDVCRQFVLEVSHAMESGPGWYTKGENGLRREMHANLRWGKSRMVGGLVPYPT